MKSWPTLSNEEYISLLRHDFYSFVIYMFYVLNPATNLQTNWHLELICARLEACRSGSTKRLIINLPPRSLKSQILLMFTAWLLGHNPHCRIISASYGQKLSSIMARDTLKILQCPTFKLLFPQTHLSQTTPPTDHIRTQAQGYRIATSIGGTLTGLGADYLIVDDPIKADEAQSEVSRNAVNDWVSSTLLSRLDDKKQGVIILIMQRAHVDDLTGFLLEKSPWECLSLPAIAQKNQRFIWQNIRGRQYYHFKEGQALHSKRESLAQLHQLRLQMGEYVFCSQYLQSPIPLEGGAIKHQWLHFYDEISQSDYEKGQIIQSWDTANTVSDNAAYSVCTTWLWINRLFYLVDVYRDRLAFPDLVKKIKSLAKEHRAHIILIEEMASGIALIQQLRSECFARIKGIKPTTDKLSRLLAQTVRLENAQVRFPQKAPWKIDYLSELTSFPQSRYSDQVDSTSQALTWLHETECISSYGYLEYIKQQMEALKSNAFPYPSRPF